MVTTPFLCPTDTTPEKAALFWNCVPLQIAEKGKREKSVIEV
jgi:hypothetical protein